MDQVTSDLMRHSLLYASEEMGIALRNSSYSPNIKERMDHSAALFDKKGRLLSQAEHMPVHLGSLPWGLSNILEYCSQNSHDVPMEEGTMIVTNNPYIAGTHLNDVTVVRPVYFHGELVAFAANKAHHADIGGKVPGSISTDASSLFAEGLIMNPVHFMRKGEFVSETLAAFMANTRTPHERKGDLKAQVAANVTGERRILELILRYGLENFSEAAEQSFAYAEKMMKSRVAAIKTGKYKAVDYLEHPDGSDIKLSVSVEVTEDKRIAIDYTGTDKQVPIPLNAVFGVTISGVYYVIRALTGDDIPANYGAFSNVEIFAPEGTILHPTFPFPVAGGNVETSQRNADLIFLALSRALPERVPAAAGGSMNNTMMGGLFKGRSWAFYETIGVGLGGRNGKDGLDGIHSNMTNTMNTPIEEIERTMPLIIERYELRENSCGPGTFRGGCGIIRAYKAIGDSPITFTYLADRGKHKPWGVIGGASGANARLLIRRKSSKGKRNELPIKSTITLEDGDTVEIHTAGGGGYGASRKRDPEKIRKDLENGLVSYSFAKKNFPQLKRR